MGAEATIRFDDRVAIVTGAGNGLGRCHALGLAARGAKLVVNDAGGTVDGIGRSAAAESVVAEIEAAGGTAIADTADVTDPAQVAAMVERAAQRWGRIDILVNNAGILRDKSFGKLALEDFRAVLKSMSSAPSTRRKRCGSGCARRITAASFSPPRPQGFTAISARRITARRKRR